MLFLTGFERHALLKRTNHMEYLPLLILLDVNVDCVVAISEAAIGGEVDNVAGLKSCHTVCNAVGSAVCNAVSAAVCSTICSAVCVAVCSAVCNAVCIAMCAAVCSAVKRIANVEEMHDGLIPIQQQGKPSQVYPHE